MQIQALTRFLPGLCLVMYFSSVVAQPSAITLFPEDTLTEAVLSIDVKSLLKSKYTEVDHPAVLEIIHVGDTSTFDVEIRCRGNIRKEVCYYPSIRMKFDKKNFAYNKLKWVNICDGEDDVDDLLEEYIAYKMYNVITEKSFGVSLVHLNYKDTEKDKSFHSYAFVIQNADELAAQFDGRVHEPTLLKNSLLNEEQLAIFYFFQYMIANTDWALGNRHNLEVITDPATNTLMPVAYDFDYSGLVNAQYAVPHESMPIDEVTSRHNKGLCINEEICEKTRLLYLEKKDAILACVEDCTYLNGKTKGRALAFIEGFYKIIDDPKDTQRIFSKECRPMN